MASISLNEQPLSGLTGLTIDVLTASRDVVETGVSLTETSAGVFEGTTVDDLDGNQYLLLIKSSAGVILTTQVYRSQPPVPTHDSEHMPDGTLGQVLVHNGTEFVARDFESLSSEAGEDVQGHYALLTNFYFVGGQPTETIVDTDDVNTWIDINFDTDTQGKFDYRPDKMKDARIAGHTGAGTQADPILFSLEGLSLRSSANFRASMTFEPEIDESQVEVRLLFTRHSGAIPDTQFPIQDTALTMTQGADIEYAADPILSFFVGDTIDTNGVGDAGSCQFQVKSTTEGILRMRALTWFIQV